MTKGYYPKKLLVEGAEDKRVLPELLELNGISWGRKPVFIQDCEGYKNINTDRVSTELQAGGLTNLGVMIDADNCPSERWQSIRNSCLKSIPDMPKKLPDTGLIHTTDGIKFGVWMMPDNKIQGMLETFLAYMIPDSGEALWQYAQYSATAAKNQGALFRNKIAKANIYTWLAWQEEPGRQLHQAIKERILNPHHPMAQVFVQWFKSLYDL